MHAGTHARTHSYHIHSASAAHLRRHRHCRRRHPSPTVTIRYIWKMFYELAHKFLECNLIQNGFDTPLLRHHIHANGITIRYFQFNTAWAELQEFGELFLNLAKV